MFVFWEPHVQLAAVTRRPTSQHRSTHPYEDCWPRECDAPRARLAHWFL